jgi:hypothetical protein
VDHRADIYALGVVFYQMLTGELPGKRIEPPSKKVQIDVRLDEIVLRALEKKPELRFQQASIFKTQLETISAEPDKSDLQNSKSKVKSRFSRTAMVRAAWIAIVAIVVLFIIRNHYTPPPTTLSQSEFLSLFQSNQIVHATINLGGQTSQLTPISGSYYKTDKDGKVTKEEVQFIAPNVFLTQKTLDELLVSDRIEARAPNAMLMNVIWGIAPIIFLGIIFLLIPGIIIYVIWRTSKTPVASSTPPLIQKSNQLLRRLAITVLAIIAVVFIIAILAMIAVFALIKPIKQPSGETPVSGETTTNFSIGQAYFPRGDFIEITSVERTDNQMTVKGHYNLVSADDATIALHITSRRPHDSPTDASQSMLITKGKGDFELIDSNVIPGLPHVNMYYGGRPFAEVYFGTKDEAEEEDQLHLTSEKKHPNPEDTYTITSVMQILNPVNLADMDDDFQDVRLLARGNESSTVEITYYPLYHPSIGENPNWHQEDAEMKQYLQPTPTENWDEAMRQDLISQLCEADIDPERLTDKQLVEQVSRWAMKRAHTTSAFGIWAVYFPNGQPTVYPLLRDAFDRQKPDSSWTDQQMFDQEVLGRSMFYNKVHGSCTSSAVYLATIFRALGIPTRLVFCIPPFDPNDDAQSQMFYDHIKNNRVRETVRSALDGTTGFDNHVFNEVYVGHQWVRLNYDTLGQPILDQFYFGLLTHVYTSSSLSEASLAETWGMRYFDYQDTDQPKLSSINPYRLISVQDHFGTNANLSNPPVPPAELTTVTIIGLLNPDSPAVPPWASDYFIKNPDNGIDFLIASKEWIPGVNTQMRAFQKHVGHEFLLNAANHPNIKVHLSGLNQSSGDGSFQAYGAQIVPEDKALLVPGVKYQIQPINISDTYRWQVASNVTFLAPQKAAFNSNETKTDSDQSLSNQPPVVVETSPISGARDVEPGEAEIRVRFSKEMTDGSWSWSTAWENSTPEFIGSPHYAADGKTCVAKAKLEPDRTYAFWLNSDNFQNFKDADGRPAVPYLLIFQTKHK